MDSDIDTDIVKFIDIDHELSNLDNEYNDLNNLEFLDILKSEEKVSSFFMLKDIILNNEIISDINSTIVLYDVILKDNRIGMYSRDPIESSIIKQLLMFVYDGKLWYIDTNNVHKLNNDPWNIDDCEEENWIVYYVPDFDSNRSEFIIRVFDESKFDEIYNN